MRNQFHYLILARNRFIVTIGLFVAFCFFFPQIAIAEKLYPVDEAQKDPSFYAFRSRLIQAVDCHDVSYIISILSDDVRGSFGSGPGVEGFKIEWRLESPDTIFWETLKDVLTHGGAFQTFDGKDVFVAPYVSSSFPQDFDSYEYAAIVGKNVKLRERPNLKSRVIKLLSYDIVKVTNWQAVKDKNENDYQWIAVELLSGEKGYVAEAYIGSPLGYRAWFKKISGRWLLIYFVSGD